MNPILRTTPRPLDAPGKKVRFKPSWSKKWSTERLEMTVEEILKRDPDFAQETKREQKKSRRELLKYVIQVHNKKRKSPTRSRKTAEDLVEKLIPDDLDFEEYSKK